MRHLLSEDRDEPVDSGVDLWADGACDGSLESLNPRFAGVVFVPIQGDFIFHPLVCGCCSFIGGVAEFKEWVYFSCHFLSVSPFWLVHFIGSFERET